MKLRIVPNPLEKGTTYRRKPGYPARKEKCMEVLQKKKWPLMQVFWSYDHLPRMSEIFSFCVCVSCFKTLQLDLRQKNMTQTRCMKQIREFSILWFFSCRHSFVCLYNFECQIYMMCDPWKLTWRSLEKSPSLEQGDISTHSWLVFHRSSC